MRAYIRLRKPSPHWDGAVRVSRATGEGLKGNVTAYVNFVSMRRAWEDVWSRTDSFSWILRMKLIGTRSSNSLTGVYRLRIFMIWNKRQLCENYLYKLRKSIHVASRQLCDNFVKTSDNFVIIIYKNLWKALVRFQGHPETVSILMGR